MLELEDQLRQYGEAVERTLLEEPPAQSTERGPHRWQWIITVAAAMVLLVGGAIVLMTSNEGSDDSLVTVDTPRPARVEHAGVFTTPTDTVLLFSDGIDGATAIDLDRRLAGRRVIDGERGGDQQFRLSLTGDHLVVGWGEIYAAPLDGGPSSKITDATIYLPASEAGQVWTLTWEGGRIGSGDAVLRRVTVDGTTTFESESFDPAVLSPVLGVPGGLLVNSPEGVAVWDADTQSIGPALGQGRAVAATTDGKTIAWCTETCAEVHSAELARRGEPTARYVSPGAQQIALSPDGVNLAVLRPAGDSAELVMMTASASGEEVVAGGLDPYGALTWGDEGRQLFYTENSYREASTRVGRYRTEDASWEIETLPVGDGLAAIAVTRDEADSFFADDLVPKGDCPGAGGSFPSERAGVCTFAFFTSDSAAECVSEGLRTIEVPDGVGLPLEEAAIRMQLAGLAVVGLDDAVRPGDSSSPNATVLAHEPPAGVKVPIGSCVGFRTDPP